jgi:hypothetical protein
MHPLPHQSPAHQVEDGEYTGKDEPDCDRCHGPFDSFAPGWNVVTSEKNGRTDDDQRDRHIDGKRGDERAAIGSPSRKNPAVAKVPREMVFKRATR